MQTSPNDNIQIALIGAGGMGQGDADDGDARPGRQTGGGGRHLRRPARALPGDLGRRQSSRRATSAKSSNARTWTRSSSLPPTTGTRRSPSRPSNAGKDVYCEKPMVHDISEGPQVIDAMKKSGHILQIGSQYASSAAFQKARELLARGLHRRTEPGGGLARPQYRDRRVAILDSARRYTRPDRLGPLPRATPRSGPSNRSACSAGAITTTTAPALAGDLYVHLLTGLHVVTGSLGPTRIYSVGGTRFWKDGRDAPDVMLCTMDYPKSERTPAFTFALRVNFASSEPKEEFGLRFTGSEGQMTVNTESIKLTRTPRETEPGMTLGTFSKAVQKAIEKDLLREVSAEAGHA